MAVQEVLNLISLIIDNPAINKSLVGKEIAQLVFLMRAWSNKSVQLQGATNAATVKNINNWIADFRDLFAGQMTKIDALSGFGGWAFVQTTVGQPTSKELFLESYRQVINALSTKDLTRAKMLSRGLAKQWENHEEFYKSYDTFIKESSGLGLSSKEVVEKFLNTKSGVQFVSLRDTKGRTWKPENYSLMYARTRSSEMENEILHDEMAAYGIDVVRISSHNTQTPLCQKFEGRVFSLTGKTAGLPILTMRTPFHPNCLHREIPMKDFNMGAAERLNDSREKKLRTQMQSWTPDDMRYINKQTAWFEQNRTL